MLGAPKLCSPPRAHSVCSQLRWTAGIPALHYRLVTLATADSPPLLLYQTPSRVGASPLFPSPPPTRRNPIPKSNDVLNSHGRKVDAQPRAHKKQTRQPSLKLVWSLKSERASDQLDVNLLRHMTTRIVHIAVTLSDVYESGLVEPPRPALCHVPLVRPLFAIARSG